MLGLGLAFLCRRRPRATRPSVGPIDTAVELCEVESPATPTQSLTGQAAAAALGAMACRTAATAAASIGGKARCGLGPNRGWGRLQWLADDDDDGDEGEVGAGQAAG